MLTEVGQDCSILGEFWLPFFFQGMVDRFPISVEGESALPVYVAGCCLISHYCYKLIHVLGFSGQDASVVCIANVIVVFCHSQFVWLVLSDTACSVSLS